MASSNKKISASQRQNVERTSGDSFRWICGLVLFALGVYAALSVAFSYFSWEVDQSILSKAAEDSEIFSNDVTNPCGPWGARIGRLLVDDSFGVFGILLPVICIIVGIRIIRQRPLRLNQSVMSLLMVMILGSLTLGFIFGEQWSLCSSSGWGGAFGCELASFRAVGNPPHEGMLPSMLGFVGTLILLVGGWILTGVFINRNFINTVNSAGNAVVDKGEHLFDVVRRKISERGKHEDEPGEEIVEEEEADEEEDVFLPTPEPAVVAEESAVTKPAVAQREESAPRVIRRAEVEESPFVELSAGGMESEVEEQPREPEEVMPSDDNPFVEVDLRRQPSARVVMGTGGLVELAPAEKPAAKTPEIEVITDEELFGESPFAEVTRPKPRVVVETRKPASDEPFEEVDLRVEPEPVPQPELKPQPAPKPQPEPADEEGIVITVKTHDPELVPEKRISTESYDPMKDLVNYKCPPVTLLEDYFADGEVNQEEIFENKCRIEETLKYFNIPIQRIKATVGPTVTLYEIVQAQGVKISKIQGLQNDIAQSLKAESGIRIIAPIPGKGTIGIEVPNRNKQIVSMYSAVRSARFQQMKAELPVVIGRTIQNENFVFDLAKMPHLLVAGATGQGKSVGLNAIITSLLYRKHPAQLKLVMIDPKMVEFSLYAKIERHFLAKMESEDEAIVTDPRKAVYTLNSLCTEMDSRLELCKQAGARNIVEYNEKFTSRRLNPQKGHRYLPYIVVVIDEFADLIMTAKEVETPVTRLAQKARAIGIHLIIATQRPSVDVITGKIKANFPARIAFRVMQMIDSRTIIDRPGADQLIGRGDMLISKDGELTRVQCALVETKEVERIVDHVARQQGYTAPYALPDYVPEGGDAALDSEESSAPVKYDSLFAEIAREAVSSRQISTSMIQRNYEVGFNRAGRIMMQLERAGIVGRQQGAKPREILYADTLSLEAKLQELGVS